MSIRLTKISPIQGPLGNVIFFLIWGSILAADELPVGKVIPDIRCADATEERYALYLPSGYTPDKHWPLILLFDPGARARLTIERFAQAAERYGFVMACSYQTQNYVAWETNWNHTLAMWKDVLARVAVDPRRMYAGGFSGGARLASRVAIHSGKIAGVIACGAGFWSRIQGKIDPPFAVVSTIGVKDMNYLELIDLEQELNLMGLPNRRLVFDGEHQWPPSEIFEQALGWLQLQAFRQEDLTQGEAMVDEQWEQRLAAARVLDAAGRFWEAHVAMSHLAEDFKGLVDISAAVKRMNQLGTKEGFQLSQKAQQEAQAAERATRNVLIGRLHKGENLNKKSALKQELAWWEGEIQRLQSAYNQAPNAHHQMAVYRLFDLLARVCYEKSVYAFREKNWQGAIFLNEVAGMIIPKQTYAFYNLGRAYAQSGKRKQALEALAQYVEYGGSVPGPLATDPLLEPLRKDARFQAILAGK